MDSPDGPDLYERIYGRDHPDDGPRGWIQWKGTNVCMDLWCVCGAHGHVDSEFFYAYRCSVCGRRYAVGQTIKLIELISPEEIENFQVVGFRTDTMMDEVT